MAELSLKQIIDKLNTEFIGETRKIVFWYDEAGDFKEDINKVQLEHAKVWILTGTNQFETKLLLEHEDTESSYLIYAPFAVPKTENNHLADMMQYSKRFSADRASLVLVDLGLPHELLPVIQRHINFFGSKDRLQRFYALTVDEHSEESLLIAMMCVLCRVKVVSFDEVLRVVLTSENLQANPMLGELAKYGLLDSFWEFCQRYFGYCDEAPNLTKLTAALFMTYAGSKITSPLPNEWKNFLLDKAGTVVAFLDSMMNNVLYRDGYDKLSAMVEKGLHVAEVFKSIEPETLCVCDSFRCVDVILIHWMTERLLAEDLSIKLGKYTIPDLCELRPKTHFGEVFAGLYRMLRDVYEIIGHAKYVAPQGFEQAIQQYVASDYLMDTWYRHFYVEYDALDVNEDLEKLRDLVENIYTNEYLGHQLPAWNEALLERGGFKGLSRQVNFYNDYLRYKKDRFVVIISDAFRYEVAHELFEQLVDAARYTSVDMSYMLSTLPSYTRLGMQALLPHTKLELSDKGQELVDGQYVIDMNGRQNVLQKAEANSVCVSFDELKMMKRAGLRQIFTGKQVIYVYHNRVDNAGENAPDDVFLACETAVVELFDMIQTLSSSANIYNFIVTADHGFIYKRDAVNESGKISGVVDKNSIVKRRYIVADHAIEDTGICHLSLGDVLDNDDAKIVSFPLSHNVFKAPGSGLNYLHGGSSPQELIVPVIEVHAERYHVETQPAEIKMVSILNKITSLNPVIEFVQSDAVSDTVKATNYTLYFEDTEGNQITGVEKHSADSRENDTSKRIFKVKFGLKNQTYDEKKKYYLVIVNQDTGIELSRHEMRIGIAFAGDFDF